MLDDPTNVKAIEIYFTCFDTIGNRDMIQLSGESNKKGIAMKSYAAGKPLKEILVAQAVAITSTRKVSIQK